MTLFGRHSTLAFAVICTVLSTGPLASAQFGFLRRGNVSYKTFKDAAGRFELEYPTKDWSPVPVASAIAMISRNDRSATLTVESTSLVEPLTPAEAAINAKIELESLKEEQPNAKDFSSEPIDAALRGGSLVRFARTGANGPERVMHYSVAVGQSLYRLDAVVRQDAAEKHEPILLHMIQSFKVPASTATSKN